MTFKANDSVVVTMPQQHGGSSIVEKGEVLAVEGDRASVMIQGEDVPRTVRLEHLRAAREVFGDLETDRPNELPVIDMIRR